MWETAKGDSVGLSTGDGTTLRIWGFINTEILWDQFLKDLRNYENKGCRKQVVVWRLRLLSETHSATSQHGFWVSPFPFPSPLAGRTCAGNGSPVEGRREFVLLVGDCSAQVASPWPPHWWIQQEWFVRALPGLCVTKRAMSVAWLPAHRALAGDGSVFRPGGEIREGRCDAAVGGF